MIALHTTSIVRILQHVCFFDPLVGYGHIWTCLPALPGRVPEGSPPEHDRGCGVSRDLVLLGGCHGQFSHAGRRIASREATKSGVSWDIRTYVCALAG